jgi:surfeit locus 1 family protein
MMRLPLIPTILVAAAVATMIGLGIWQLRRADWKEGLIAQYQANAGLPAIAWPALPPADDKLLYRRASGFCLQPVAWRAVAGRNAKSETGWAHIAACRTGGAEGPGMQVDIGWSRSSDTPAWRGGPVTGLIVPDRKHRIRLVADRAAPGLEPSRPPSAADLPNNHMLYAVQWFFFALAAAIIYLLALRRRKRDSGTVADAPPTA